jgi:carboxyl-terminal processing protease
LKSPAEVAPVIDLIRDNEILDSELPKLAEELLTARVRPAIPVNLLRTLSPTPNPNRELSREERLLGLFRIWTIVRYFDPHLELASLNWNTMLKEWIPAVERTQTTHAYYVSLERLSAKLNDSHSSVGHESLSGQFDIPVFLRKIEGKVIITHIREGAGKDVRAGDEVIAIDGMPIRDFEADARSRTSCSTEEAFEYYWKFAFAGKRDTPVTLVLRRNGESRTVSLRRSVPVPDDHEPTPDFFRHLDGGVAYMNLMQAASFEALNKAWADVLSTPGLVIDLRGRPDNRIFGVREWLRDRLYDQHVPGDYGETPFISATNMNLRFRSFTRFDANRSQPQPGLYYGKPVVILLDAQTRSYGESICLGVTPRKRVTFVGSRTGGSTGDPTRVALPGGGSFSFEGSRAYFPDGRPFQNVGIVPDVLARPTIGGVHAGRDEVLEAGLETLRKLVAAIPKQ